MRVIVKATSDGIGYASKSDYEYEGKKYQADLQNNDQITVLDSGAMEPGTWGDRLVIKVKTRNGDKKTSFNQQSINAIASEYGEDTETWIGKTLNVFLHKTVIANERVTVAYIVPNGWSLDDYGYLSKSIKIDPIFTPKTENQQSVEDIRNQSVEEPPF